MDYRKKKYLGIMISMLGILIGYYFSSPINHDICRKTLCTKIVGGDVGIPLFLFSSALLFIFLMFLFVKEDVFNIWKKFAKIFLPVAMLLVVITPTHYGGLVGIDKEIATWWLAGLFLFISIGIIVWKSIHLRKNK
ncbi:MAG: hypothetical protein RBS48_12675 [Ignavibacteriaceae bacterium]|jgi:hypothetical protein|nr:hypothetical protein [Ignavibacteriaceae bacterium]